MLIIFYFILRVIRDYWKVLSKWSDIIRFLIIKDKLDCFVESGLKEG